MVNYAMAETWLPHEPPPPPAPKSSARRTLVLWVGLIALFVIIYAFVSPSSPGQARSHSESPSTWWIWLVCAGPVVLVVVLFGWHFAASRRFLARQVPAHEAFCDGEYERAAQQFGALAQRYRLNPSLSSLAAYNQARSLIYDGDAAVAVGILLGIERLPSLPINGIRRPVAVDLALAFAIGGDLDKAQRWLEAARERSAGIDPGHEYARLAEIEGLLLCRAAKFEDAIRHYDATWERMQSRLTVRDMRAVWLLRAFAVASISGPRDGAAAEIWLRLLRATQPGPLDWLTGHWPELAAFATREVAPAVRAAESRA